ncbi:MAG: hypothetical protein J6C15_10785 [Bacteroidaceae bacterium]|nr:hypothetical protein [Bacteroidaceae bacterium]
MEKELTLQEKEERWISALKRKEECRTMEEWDFEVMSEVLYEDDEFIFWKECIDTYTFRKKGVTGVSSELDYFLEDCTMVEIVKNNDFGNKTFMDFMREKGFPITFKTWDD